MSPLPPDLATLDGDFVQNGQEAAAIVEGLSEEQLNFQPKGGKAWSIAQCLDHLTVSARVYLEPMRAAVDDAKAKGLARKDPLALPLVGRWFVGYLEPPPRFKGPAPKKIVPASTKRKEDVLPELLAASRDVRALLAECTTIDVNGVRFVNPFLPLVRFTLGTGFSVMAAHERRHLYQARGVKDGL